MLSSSIARMLSTLRATSPFLAERTEVWTKRLSQTDKPEDYFKHPLAFPALLFPWWVECAFSNAPDMPFQTDLMYSSVNGYYFIRMIDNVVDGHSDQEPRIL